MTDVENVSRRRQWSLICGVFAVVVAALAAGYYLFLSGGYTVLADQVRPGEAAAIVAELDKRGTAYKLRDGGTTILVPDGEADATRLALVRSDAAVAGQIGFELFNKSDMGLTNFAQKINYQRALQGELVRTITLMDGVEKARVHLALPERALFRDDRTEPSAAVTVTMRAGLVPEPGRISGIQQLVAAAVPELPAERVVVLDADGRVISKGVASSTTATADNDSAEAEARAAVEQYHRARARAAIDAARPDLRYQLRVMAIPQADGTVDPTRWTPGTSGEARNFRLRLMLITSRPLDPADQAAIEAAVRSAAGLDDTQGDMLVFETGPVITASPPASIGSAKLRQRYAPAAIAEEPRGNWGRWWLWAAALVIIAALLLARRLAARAPALLSADEQNTFAQTLRRRLALADGAGDAAR